MILRAAAAARDLGVLTACSFSSSVLKLDVVRFSRGRLGVNPIIHKSVDLERK